MRQYKRGSKIEAGDLLAPGANPGDPLLVRDVVGEFPHGHRYRVKQNDIPLLLTVVDPVLAADGGVRASVIRTLSAARGAEHRNLLNHVAHGG